MAYQNVGTPRFYINVVEWLDSVGYRPPPTGGSYEYHVLNRGDLIDRFRTLPVVAREQPLYVGMPGTNKSPGPYD